MAQIANKELQEFQSSHSHSLVHLSGIIGLHFGLNGAYMLLCTEKI